MTNSAQFSQITDELLSAYLDQAVSATEKNLVEAAVAADPEIAWRLESLRQTVQLLRALPPVALPRSFILTEAQLAAAPEPVAARTVRPVAGRLAPPKPEMPSSGWQTLLAGWRNFWQGGSPLLRNAMAASFAVLLVLLIGNDFLTTRTGDLPTTGSAHTLQLEAAPTQLPTVVAVAQSAAPEPVLPATQANAPGEEAVTQAAVAAEGASEPQGGSTDVGATTARLALPTEPEIFAANAPPGEDQGVALDPGAGGAISATGLGGGQESALVEQASAAPPPAVKQPEPAQSNSVASTAFASPLAEPVAVTTTAYSTAVTATMTQTAGFTHTDALTSAQEAVVPEAQPASSVVPSNTVSVTDTAPVADDPQPASGGQAPAQPPPGVAAPSDRIGLLQLVSALVTLVLAGLWWRSR